jgi:hypothetical protein
MLAGREPLWPLTNQVAPIDAWAAACDVGRAQASIDPVRVFCPVGFAQR